MEWTNKKKAPSGMGGEFTNCLRVQGGTTPPNSAHTLILTFTTHSPVLFNLYRVAVPENPTEPNQTKPI